MEQFAPIFEAIMLICFGIAWPLSIIRMVKTKKSAGKSIWFLTVIQIGYLSGIMFKISSGIDNVIYLYIFNFIMVSIDLMLSLKYRN